MVDPERVSPDTSNLNPSYAFLNIPYDARFEGLYLAYIAGISAYGLVPRATLEIPGGSRRLDRIFIFELIRTCRYSFHDLSRVELDPSRPPTPRFNMPFELGLVVAWDKLHPGEHVWFVFEAKERRLLKSLSDLAGTDAYVHGGRPRGLFRQFSNALVRSENPPTVEEWRRFTVPFGRACLRSDSGPERGRPLKPEHSLNSLSQRAR